MTSRRGSPVPTIRLSILDHLTRDYIPRRLEGTVQRNGSRKEIQDAHDLDQIDFHYRRYLGGYRRTLHRVLYELRCAHVDHGAILEMIKGIEDLLQHHELYELLARHRDAMVKITKAIK